jgi:hypothetical protein
VGVLDPLVVRQYLGRDKERRRIRRRQRASLGWLRFVAQFDGCIPECETSNGGEHDDDCRKGIVEWAIRELDRATRATRKSRKP